jgi:hypothetical protein
VALDALQQHAQPWRSEGLALEPGERRRQRRQAASRPVGAVQHSTHTPLERQREGRLHCEHEKERCDRSGVGEPERRQQRSRGDCRRNGPSMGIQNVAGHRPGQQQRRLYLMAGRGC